MRGFATVLAAIAVIALGYWAYHQTVMTQQALREVERLQRAIGSERERLSILRAEWAYLNRPDRLRDLADLNFDRLGLMPLSPDQFGLAVQIPYAPLPDPDLPETVLDSASTPLQQEETP
jgi:hypothetical protein